MRPIAFAFALFGLLPFAGSGQQESMPQEYVTLIDAYSVGRLTTANLRGACRWTQPSSGVREDLAHARRQNVQFCEGFLVSSLEFASLDPSVLAALAEVEASEVTLRCDPRGLVPSRLRTQLLSSPRLQGKERANGSATILATLLSCRR